MSVLRLPGLLMLVCAWFGALAAPVSAAEKSPAEKSPADVSFDAFMALRDNREAKPTQQHFEALSLASLDVLAKHPGHRRITTVISRSTDYLGGRDNAPYRAAWLAHLRYNLLRASRADGISAEGKAALAALDAAISGVQARDQPTRDNLTAYREKIDELAALPSNGRFLPDQEINYANFLLLSNPKAARAHVEGLMNHKEKRVVDRARDELNLMNARAQPFELQFTGLDGKAVDFASLRGRFVYLVFFNTDAKDLNADLMALKELYSAVSRKNFEVVAVVCDAPEHREKTDAFLKKAKLRWPVYVYGPPKGDDFARKLNVRTLPAGFLFDPNGHLVRHALGMKSVAGELKKYSDQGAKR